MIFTVVVSVLDSYFNRWQIQEVKGSHFQYSNDKKNWKDYILGDDENIDKLFEIHQFEKTNENWTNEWITNFIRAF